MRVFVDTTTGSTFSIELNSHDRVLDIKKKIEKSQGVAVSTQELYHKGEVLRKNDQDLRVCRIFNNSRLLLVLPYHKYYPVLQKAPSPSNYITNIEDSPGKNQGWPIMARSNNRQMLHQMEHSQVPPSNAIEAFGNQGLPAMARRKDDQMLHQTKQSLVPPNPVDAFFNKDWPATARNKDDQMLYQFEKYLSNSVSIDEILYVLPEMPLTDLDVRKMQGFWPASTNEGNVNIQESLGRNDNNQDLLQRESSNTFGDFSFGEDRRLSTEHFTNSQSYSPVMTTGDNITQDLLVRVGRSNQVVQTENCQPIREVINFLDSSAEVGSLKKPPEKMRVLVLQYFRDIPVTGFRVTVNASDKVEELRKELKKMHQRIDLNLTQEGYFLIHKQRALNDDQSFQWNGVADGDSIDIFPEHVKDFLTKGMDLTLGL